MNVIKQIVLVLVTFILIQGCHTNKQVPQASNSNWHQSNQEIGNSDELKRKIITSADIKMVVENVDSTNIKISKLLNSYEGYASEMGTVQSVIRIKVKFFDAFLAELLTYGTTKEKNIQGLDVTDEYMDNEIRLENSLKSRERYLELLKKAETVEDILKVEKELERLNETIDIIKGRMNRLVHLSDFATITIQYEEKKKPGLIGYLFVGAYKSVRWLFVRN